MPAATNDEIKQALREILWVKSDHFLIKFEEACKLGSSVAGIPRRVARMRGAG